MGVINERDELGPDLVPDYMTSVKDGGFYGWPCSYFGQHLDPRVEPQRTYLVEKARVHWLDHSQPACRLDTIPLEVGLPDGSRMPAKSVFYVDDPVLSWAAHSPKREAVTGRCRPRLHDGLLA